MPKFHFTSDFEKNNNSETESIYIKQEIISDNDEMSDFTSGNAEIFNVRVSADFETKTHFDGISSIKNEVLLDNEKKGLTYTIKKKILNSYEEEISGIHEDQMSAIEFKKILYYDLRKRTELNCIEEPDVNSEKSAFDHRASIDTDEFSDFDENERKKLDNKKEIELYEEDRGNLDSESITDSGKVTTKELRQKNNKSTRSQNAILPSNLQPNENEKQRKYKCCLCWKKFKLKHHLNQHILSHTRAKSDQIHECPTCSKQFKMKHHFKRHLLSHSKEKQYKCAICDKSYVAKYDMKKHMKTHLVKTDLKTQLFTCDICGLNCDRDSKLQKHKHTHDKICGLCGKEFLNYKYLRYHLRVHAKLASFPCDVCGKLFPFKAALMEHSRRHTGEKPYECEVCNRSFSTKSNQMRHTKSHFHTRKCKHCHKEFGERKEFQQHLKTCRVKYRCDKCDWDFKKSSNYKRHLLIHVKNLNSPSKLSYLTPESITIETIK